MNDYLQELLDMYSKYPAVMRRIRRRMGIETENSPELSDREKRAINRQYRDKGTRYALYPEVDTAYERLRYRVLRLWRRKR